MISSLGNILIDSDNGGVHPATANDSDFRKRVIGGSACNAWFVGPTDCQNIVLLDHAMNAQAARGPAMRT